MSYISPRKLATGYAMNEIHNYEQFPPHELDYERILVILRQLADGKYSPIRMRRWLTESLESGPYSLRIDRFISMIRAYSVSKPDHLDWRTGVPLSCLQGEQYYFAQADYEIKSYAERSGIPRKFQSGITGAIVSFVNGNTAPNTPFFYNESAAKLISMSIETAGKHHQFNPSSDPVYAQLWLTESSRPYELSSYYYIALDNTNPHRLKYWGS